MDNPRQGKTFSQEELTLPDYCQAIWKHKRIALWLSGAFTLVALVFSFLSPNIYQSTATIVSPSEVARTGLPSSIANSGLVSTLQSLSVPSLTPHRDLFESVLKSRTMAMDVVERFDLKKRYDTEYIWDAVKELQSACEISVSMQGVISIAVEATDPVVAADLANFFISNLDSMLSRFETTQGSRQRAFIAKRLAETEEDLHRTEEALRKFKETHRAISLQDQAKGSVEAAALVKGDILASEVQLEGMRSFATDQNPQVVRLRTQITEMKRQLAAMQYGEGLELPSEKPATYASRKEIHVPFVEFPELVIELARLDRNVKVQETVYMLLTQQLEEAKIMEARDMPTVQVLDRAVPVERKLKPRILLNAAKGCFSGLFLGVLIALFLRYLEQWRARVPSGDGAHEGNSTAVTGEAP